MTEDISPSCKTCFTEGRRMLWLHDIQNSHYCAGKTLTAPLDRVKLLLQTRGGFAQGSLRAAAKRGNVVEALLAIGRQEGFRGYWKGNLPQVSSYCPYNIIGSNESSHREPCLLHRLMVELWLRS